MDTPEKNRIPMAETWIVVADSTRARIFTPTRQGQALERVKELCHPSSRTHERELTTDRPGRTFDSEGPGRHAMSQNVSPKEHEAWKLCKELANEIETARAQGRIDRVALVAAPSFLGELRKTLNEQTARLIIYALDKNLAHMNDKQIVEHLPASVLQDKKSRP